MDLRTCIFSVNLSIDLRELHSLDHYIKQPSALFRGNQVLSSFNAGILGKFVSASGKGCCFNIFLSRQVNRFSFRLPWLIW